MNLITVIISLFVVGVISFQALLGVPPTSMEAFGVGTMIVLILWIIENA